MHFMFWHGSIDPAGSRGKSGGGWASMTALSFLCLSVSVLFLSGFSVCLSFTFLPPSSSPPSCPCLVTLPSLMAFSCWLFWCPQCSSRLLNSDQYPPPPPPPLPICPLINYGCSSHITYKISIVFVNGWSIFHLRSSSKLLFFTLLALSSPLPSRFVSVLVHACLWFLSLFSNLRSPGLKTELQCVADNRDCNVQIRVSTFSLPLRIPSPSILSFQPFFSLKRR